MQDDYAKVEKLTTAQVAALLRVTEHTVYMWRRRKVGPPYHRRVRAIFYFKSDVLNWELSNPGD